MLLEILISHYREPPQVVGRLLSSMDRQRGVDFRDVSVLICNDGHDVPLDDKSLSGHPYEVAYFEREHGGVSSTRNALLDRATADYVTFFDCDDILAGDDALHEMTGRLDGCDLLSVPYLEEDEQGNLTPRGGRRQMIQGKVFRREFLVEGGIRFDDDLVMSGDPYFLWQAYFLAKGRRYGLRPAYVWKYNRGSVSRDSDVHAAYAYWYRVETFGLLHDMFARMGRNDEASFFANELFADSYVMAHTEMWRVIGGTFEEGVGLRRIAWWTKRLLGDYRRIGERDRKSALMRAARERGSMPPHGYDGMREWLESTWEAHLV